MKFFLKKMVSRFVFLKEEDEELRIYANAKKNIARLRREREIKAHQ